jgi:hypothetical protein
VKIAIIGTGKMATGFARALAPTHEVVVGSRDPAGPRDRGEGGAERHLSVRSYIEPGHHDSARTTQPLSQRTNTLRGWFDLLSVDPDHGSMVQRTIVELTDDIDGKPADETILFALDNADARGSLAPGK